MDYRNAQSRKRAVANSMNQVNGSDQLRLNLSRQWLVKLLRRVLNRPISDVALYVISALWSTLWAAGFYFLLMFILLLVIDSPLPPPTFMELVSDDWELSVSLLAAIFFGHLTFYIVYSVFMTIFVPIKKSETVRHEKRWSPLTTVVVFVVLIVCVSISIKNVVKYFPNIAYGNNGNTDQAAIINNVKNTTTDADRGSLQTPNAQESAEKENDIDTDFDKMDDNFSLNVA